MGRNNQQQQKEPKGEFQNLPETHFYEKSVSPVCHEHTRCHTFHG